MAILCARIFTFQLQPERKPVLRLLIRVQRPCTPFATTMPPSSSTSKSDSTQPAFERIHSMNSSLSRPLPALWRAVVAGALTLGVLSLAACGGGGGGGAAAPAPGPAPAPAPPPP